MTEVHSSVDSEPVLMPPTGKDLRTEGAQGCFKWCILRSQSFGDEIASAQECQFQLEVIGEPKVWTTYLERTVGVPEKGRILSAHTELQ